MSRQKKKPQQRGSRKRVSRGNSGPVRRPPRVLPSLDAMTDGAVLVVCDRCKRQQINMHIEPMEIELGGLYYTGCRFCGNATGRYA